MGFANKQSPVLSEARLRKIIQEEITRIVESADHPRSFTKEDWYEFGGAEKFDNGKDPLIIDVNNIQGLGGKSASIIGDRQGIEISFGEGESYHSAFSAMDPNDVVYPMISAASSLRRGRIPKGFSRI